MHAHTGPEWERFTVTPAGEKGAGGGGGGKWRVTAVSSFPQL